jgi:cell division protein FtsL
MKRILMVLAMLVAVALVVACAMGESGSGVSSQLQTAQKIAKLEKKIDANQQEMDGLVKQYVQQGGQDLGSVVGQGLTPDQKQVLEARLKNEQGIGYGDLVSDILGKQKSIEDLKVKVQDLEKTLPAPVEVAKGERHVDIAMAYLTKDKGLDAPTAKRLVQQVNLMDELVPGFKVWNFYNDGVYGTFVTQGDAKVSPYGVIQHAKQTLVNEKNTAIAQRDALATEKASLTQQVADLTTRREELTQEVSLLQAERQDLTNKVNDLQTQRDDLQARNNSVFYRIGTKKNLVQEGAIRTSWFSKPKVAKYGEDQFPQHLDLRSGDTITVSAKLEGLDKIRRVSVAPGSLFKANEDYVVTLSPDGQEAALRILAKDKFRASRSIVILVD